jgi:hypothetical protein
VISRSAPPTVAVAVVRPAQPARRSQRALLPIAHCRSLAQESKPPPALSGSDANKGKARAAADRRERLQLLTPLCRGIACW